MLIFDVHCILAGNALAQGSPEQRERWLRPLVAGEFVGAFATSEPGASSDLSPDAVQTAAERDGDTWVLRGRKRWITNSVVAGVVVVLARTGDRLTTFIVPTDAPRLDRDAGPEARQLAAGLPPLDARLGDEEPGPGAPPTREAGGGAHTRVGAVPAQVLSE